MTGPWLFIVGIVVCLGVSFVLSGMETGLLALNRLRLRHWMRQGNRSARRLHGFLQNPERCLWIILVGNMLANFCAMTLVVLLLHDASGGNPWVWLSTVIVAAFLLFALVDLLPKMLFQQWPTRLSLAFSGFYQCLHFGLSPLVAPVAWLATGLLHLTGGRRFTGRLFSNLEELRLVIQDSNQTLTLEERSMVNRVLDLQGMTVGGLAVPLDDVTTVPADSPVSDLLDFSRREAYGRFPVQDRRTGRLTGYLDVQSLLYATDLPPNRTAAHLARPALTLHESDLIEFALGQFRRSGQRFAVVVDRSRQQIGILTLEDILRYIFGRLTL